MPQICTCYGARRFRFACMEDAQLSIVTAGQRKDADHLIGGESSCIIYQYIGGLSCLASTVVVMGICSETPPGRFRPGGMWGDLFKPLFAFAFCLQRTNWADSRALWPLL
jgi:hypothetical protein